MKRDLPDSEPVPRLRRSQNILAFDQDWQVPAATEKAAHAAIAGLGQPLDFEYLGIPWATAIDGLRGDAESVGRVMMAVKDASLTPLAAPRRVTVAQHIHAMHFAELFKACGVTDIFWSHAVHDQPTVRGMRIHPFPLFPAQAPEPSRLPLDRPRKYLANFIGAYNPAIYLTNVRQVIFDDPNAHGDLLILKRDAWHFDRAVYEEQVKGQRPEEARLALENRHAQEYLDAINASWFTLCPSGSGPNSIRIFESLHLGSIPIILTTHLRLPSSAAAWSAAAIIEEDSEAGYDRAIARARAMSPAERTAMLEAGRALADRVGPTAYAGLVMAGLSAPNATQSN